MSGLKQETYNCFFSQHLRTSGDFVHETLLAGSYPRNLGTEKAFRKYFGKKLKSFTHIAHSKGATYRCKALKTLKLLASPGPRCSIFSVKQLEILSDGHHKGIVINKLSGYKSLTCLKVVSMSYALKPAFFVGLRTFNHLESLCLRIEDVLLIQNWQFLLKLEFLKELDLEIYVKTWNRNLDDQDLKIFSAFIKSKTLSHLRFSLPNVKSNSEFMHLFFDSLSKTTIPSFEIYHACPRDCNVDNECLEAALSKVDLFTTLIYDSFYVSCGTNQSDPYQPMAKAKRKLTLYVSQNYFHQMKYVPKSQQNQSKLPKKDDLFDLAESLKLLFCNNLDTSFSLFRASNIKCVKALHLSFAPLDGDKTLEGPQILENLIQNSPWLELFALYQLYSNQVKFGPILNALAKLKHIEVLELQNSIFQNNSQDFYFKPFEFLPSLKKLTLNFGYKRVSDCKTIGLPFGLADAKGLRELRISSYISPEAMRSTTEAILKLDSLERIIIHDIAIFEDKEKSITKLVEGLIKLGKLQHVFLVSNEKLRLKSLPKYDVIRRVSKNLYDKVRELLQVNKSIGEFVIINPSLFQIRCIRF